MDDRRLSHCAATRQWPSFFCVNLGIKCTFYYILFLYVLDCKLITGSLYFKSHNFPSLLSITKSESAALAIPRSGVQHVAIVCWMCMLRHPCKHHFTNVQTPREEGNRESRVFPCSKRIEVSILLVVRYLLAPRLSSTLPICQRHRCS